MVKASPIWIEKEKRWKFNPQHDGKRKSFYSSKPGRAGSIECKRKAAEWIESGTKHDKRLRDCWPDYLQDVAARGGTDSVLQRDLYGKHYIKPALGHKKVSAISDQDWQDVINAAAIKGVSGKPLSRKTLKNLRGTVTDFFQWAHRSRLMDNKPVLYVPRSATGKRHIIQPADLHKLFGDHDHWYINSWRMMAVTGLRPGEVYGLTRDDVAGGLVRISRAVNVHREITAGKNSNAVRILKSTVLAQKIIDDQISKVDKAGMLSPWLFPARDGQPASQNTVYKAWRKFAATEAIACSPYELRHSFISIMKNSLSLGLMKRQVGHSAAMDTLGTYGHDLDGELDEAAAIIDGTLTSLIDNTQSAPTCVIRMDEARKAL